MKIILSILLLFNLSTAFADNSIYYIDNETGNDSNSGKTARKAWKTLEKVNAIGFQPGDRILLKRGQSFKGSVFLKGSGRAGLPIKLGAYGTGKRPVIQSIGYDYSILILNSEYWEIADLETTGSDKAGIFIGCTKDSLVLNYFRIINCFIHDIGNDDYIDWDFCKLTGGIVIANGEIDRFNKPVHFNSLINDAVIDGCTVRYIKRWTCISISSGILNNVKGNAHFIRNCTVEYSIACGIRMNGVQNSFIEYSTMYKNGAWPKSPNQDWGGLGAWFFESDNCTIQFCEASYIDNWHNDGGAFDIDYYQRNSVIQYCYGHDCHGYGASVFGADASFPTENSTIRYNIFSNNARDSAWAYQGDIYVFTWGGGLLNGVNVHNNTSYWNPASDAAAFMCDADFTGNKPNIFRDNIIYSEHPRLVYLKNDSMDCNNNIYWVTGNKKPEWIIRKQKYHSLEDWQQATGQDKQSRYTDPILTNAGVDSGGLETQVSSDYKGNIVLLSFINTDPEQQTDNGQAMRSQLTFIRSMKRQYEEKGLRVILVDRENGAGRKNSKEQMRNFILDNELDSIVIIGEAAAQKMMKTFAVERYPTTFLLSRDGRVNQRWNNTVLPSQMAFAIEKQINKKKDDLSTDARTIFPGFPAARPLSEKIWIVDGGQQWKAGEPNMVKILVLDDEKVDISLTVINAENGRTEESRMASPEQMPKEESNILLSNLPADHSGISTALLPVFTKRKGNYLLNATVRKKGSSETLYTGSVKINVE